jgi:predicted ATPase
MTAIRTSHPPVRPPKSEPNILEILQSCAAYSGLYVVGKTTVALSVAEALIAAYDYGIRFVDFAPLRDPRLVEGAVVSALGSLFTPVRPAIYRTNFSRLLDR